MYLKHFFSHLHGREIQAQMASSLLVKIARYVWTEGPFLTANKRQLTKANAILVKSFRIYEHDGL